jgi:hypothetical protein
MTTIIINEKSKKGKIIIELIKELGIGQIIDGPGNYRLNDITLQAVEEAEAGKTIKCNSFEDYLEKVK